MFKLQKLEITGFKSFADYTEIIFTGDGITAVVGPNGCGKSNISDAITWVLGEQRVKNLRGGEMQDVIFAGAKVRQPSGMAEVVLHLVRVESNDVAVTDDSDEIDEIDVALSELDLASSQQLTINSFSNNDDLVHSNGYGNGHHQLEVADISTTESFEKTKRSWKPRRAGLEFAPGEAVSVTRRLYRSGDSDYLLNGRSCRLRDIQDLFAGTGLSGGHYALVQQEKISQILSAKPSERRQLIEEAAGITKFRTRQRAAEIRLESAKTNLRRISDIVSEVDKQVNSLRRQAARTRRYKEIGQMLRELLVQAFSAEGRKLSKTLTNLRAELDQARRNEDQLGETVKLKAEIAQTATNKARQAEDYLAGIRQMAAENALRRERLSRDFAHQTEQKTDLQARGAALNQEIQTLTERLSSVSADKNRLQEKTQSLSQANESESAALLAAQEDYQKQLQALRNTETEIEKKRQEIFRHATAAERFREIVKQQTNALERVATRAAGLERESERAEQTRFERIGELTVLNAEITSRKEALRESQAARQSALQSVTDVRRRLQTFEQSLANIRDDANAVNARRETLEKLNNQNALLAPAVQKLFVAAEKIGVKLQGTLADLLTVEAKYERAVEAVLGTHLQTVFVESTEDALKISEWLKNSGVGKLNLLVNKPESPAAAGSSSIETANPPAASGGSDSSVNILDLLGIDNNLKFILQEVLPLDFRVVEDLTQALKHAEENCVTLAGELVSQNRLFSFGQTQSNEKNGILSFKRELRELAARAANLKNDFERAETQVKNVRQDLSEAEKIVSEITSKIVSSEKEFMSIELNAKSIGQEIERAERHKRVVADERERLETERADLEAKQLKTEADKQTAEDELKKANFEADNISAHLAETRRAVELANQILSEQRAAAAAAGERRRSLQNALRRVEQEQAELASRLESRRKDSSASNARLEQLSESLTELETELAKIAAEKEHESEEIVAATRELSSTRSFADKFAAELSEANVAAAVAKDARAAVEVNQAETIVKLQNLSEICQHELNQSLSDLPSPADDFDLPDGKRRLEDLREKLESFGAVNLLALEELSEAEERLLFLTSQRKDIVDGIEAAEDALDEIKRRSREKFEFAFARINRNFSELFSEIFGGGHGEMNILEAADVLETGVEIVAQPPGKRLQNLLLLSGGEKALTAIALVLAIFKFRPAPFCLLDEVDAPLDEANVGRFVEKVREMSQKIQFIVITHNKRTMEAARALYGVTMEEAGISKIVSVKFE